MQLLSPLPFVYKWHSIVYMCLVLKLIWYFVEFQLKFPTVLLQENFLNPTQRLIAFAVIHQAYASQQPSSNPFISKLVDVS